MVEFLLPANSKIGPGKTHAAPAGAANVRRFKIYRWEPDSGENPRLDTFEIDRDACGPMVLDALIKKFPKINGASDVFSPVGTANAYDAMHLMAKAIDKALRLRRCNRDVVAHYLYPDEPFTPPTFPLDGREHLQGVTVNAPDLAVYRGLMGEQNS